MTEQINNAPARDKIDFDATLFVCGYTVDEAKMTDNVVVHCRICDAPMMRSMADIKYRPNTQMKPCKDCQRAFAGFRWIMWSDRVRGQKNAIMRKWRAEHVAEMRSYLARRYYATKGTAMDGNVYHIRHRYATKGAEQ